MSSLILIFSALLTLSTTLIIPISPSIPQAQSHNSSALTAWPPVPFTTDTGHHLQITITRLGLLVVPPRRSQILSDITELHRIIATEGNPYEKLAGVYARSTGAVWTVFASNPDVDLKRHQALQVLTAVWYLMLDCDPREVLWSRVTLEGSELATFAMRFYDPGRGVEG